KPSPDRIGAGSVLKSLAENLANTETREHKAESILRYMELAYGQRDQLGRVDRLDPASPAKTVIAGGTKGGGRSHLHPEVPRTLSVRESARLQSFPDDYEFVGTSGRQFTQVGNAVPPVLAAQIGQSILRSFFQR
ncbi:MAG: DNA cytosine methyltransferase, partial [Blastocatellia bacterium]